MLFEVTAPVMPTESAGKVLKACRTLFPELPFEVVETKVFGEGESMPRTFLEVIGTKQKIKATVQKVLEANFKNGKTHIELNKQAALHGIVNIVSKGTGSSLGEITLRVKGEGMEKLLGSDL